ncbi:MAG: rod shape-determining protein MreC [Candidatus Melainabacteria bacterium]|nr:rod shape-determining protein MreC [Candidatus Melainabacteria bacterium]
MVSFKKPLFIQNITPRLIFTFVISLIVVWVLARPLKAIGEEIYFLLGSLTNNVLHNISSTKSIAGELITSKELVKKQAKLILLFEIKIKHLESQVKEIENLRNLLNLKKRLKYKTIPTTVIGRSADNWHKQIILDKGGIHNVMTGDSVISPQGVIGQVVEANTYYSIVQLISDPGYQLGCKVAKKNILGILSGKTNSISLLEFIPIDTNIAVGDLVVTSGISTKSLSPTYPPGHPVGKVIRISKKKKKASDLYIEVQLSENLNSLNNVLVFSPD